MDNVYLFEDRDTLEHEARQWLVRLDGDEPLQSTEKQALQAWMVRSPAHRQELVRIAEFWDSSNVLTELLIPMHQVARVSQRSYSVWAGLKHLVTPGGFFASTRGGIALAFSMVLAVSILFKPVAFDASNGIYAAAIGELRVETLADGSVLHINTDSQVQVDYSEQVRKIRLLRGEAHFEVAHNQDWAFEVYAGEGRVKAVGTAFSVRLDAERLNVIVTDGRVELAAARSLQVSAIDSISTAQSADSTAIQSASIKSAAAQQAPVILHEKVGSLGRGEGASFIPATRTVKRQLLAQATMPSQLSWRQGYLVFEGQPLSEVVAELNRYLPETVEIIDETLKDNLIGGRFKVTQLDAVFDVLEVSFNMQVTRQNGRIQLSSKVSSSPDSESDAGLKLQPQQ